MAEKSGVPAVVVVATSFLSLPPTLGKAEGVPELRTAEYAGALEVDSDDVIRQKFVDKTFGLIDTALTTPLAAATEGNAEAVDSAQIVLAGTLDEVNEFFRGRLWTDGLAIVPPTIDRVNEFLKYTDHAPDEEIAILPPGNLVATPWNIAVNAVMAGCRPEYMPVLIAAVQAMADKSYNMSQLGNTGGEQQFAMVNGPIIKQLEFESGAANGSVADTPNPAFGRAIGLIRNNIADLKPGQQYVATYGYFIPRAFSEDEDGLYAMGWEPYSVRRGFDKNDSTVTMGGFENWGVPFLLSGDTPEKLMQAYVDWMKSAAFKWTTFGGQQSWNIFITRTSAEKLAAGGYSPEDVAQYLFEQAEIPAEWYREADKQTYTGYSPDLVHIFVTGDPIRNRAMVLDSDYVIPATVAIELPADWDALMTELGYPALETFYR